MDGCLHNGKQQCKFFLILFYLHIQVGKHSTDSVDSNNGNNNGQDDSNSDNKDDNMVGAFDGCT